MTLSERIVELLKERLGLSDRKIADELLVGDRPQQPVNIACRELEKRGIIIRRKTDGNPIGNYLAGQELSFSASKSKKTGPIAIAQLSEDTIKEFLENWLITQGWKTKAAWGRDRGIDIDATKEIPCP